MPRVCSLSTLQLFLRVEVSSSSLGTREKTYVNSGVENIWENVFNKQKLLRYNRTCSCKITSLSNFKYAEKKSGRKHTTKLGSSLGVEIMGDLFFFFFIF